MINYLLIPGSSDPEKRSLQLIGKFGIGFFTVFTDADRVEIKTSNGGLVVYHASIVVKRDEDGKIVDLNIEYLYESENIDDYQGTEIKRIKSYSKENVLQAQLEGFRLTNQINYFVGGLLAPVSTLSHGEETPVAAEKKVHIRYNSTPVQEPQREFLAEVYVQGLGFIKMYRQANVSTSRVEQSGLFVSALGYPWTGLVPDVFQDELGQGLVIVLPVSVKLNSDRSGVCLEHMELIQKTIFVLYAEALLYLCLQKDHYLKTLPRDFYAQSALNYGAISKRVSAMRHEINRRLHADNGEEWYGNWTDDFPVSAIERYRDDRFLAVQLLTLIEEKQHVTLSNVVSMPSAQLNACPAFKSRIEDAKHQHEYEKKAAPKVFISPDDWTREQKILALVITSLYEETGMGFSEVVFFEQPESGVIAYVQQSTGHLSADGRAVVYPLHMNVCSKLYSQRVEWLLKRDIAHLIFDQEAANLIRTLAHETAHTEEYKINLSNAQSLIDDYQSQQPGSMSDELVDALRCEVVRHFIASKDASYDIYGRLEELASEERVPEYNRLPRALLNRLSIWAGTVNKDDEGCCWTHNADEKLQGSFINMMKRVVNTWVNSGVFTRFEAIVDAAFDACPDDAPSLFMSDDVTGASLGISGYGAFFQPAPLVALPPMQTTLNCTP